MIKSSHDIRFIKNIVKNGKSLHVFMKPGASIEDCMIYVHLENFREKLKGNQDEKVLKINKLIDEMFEL